MKIAIVSDIHANPLAFDAVLRDIRRKGCTMLLCLGDYLMAGYDPNGIIKRLEMLLSSKSPFETKVILGNTDLMITHFVPDGIERIKKVSTMMAYALEDDLKIIKPESIDFLRQFPTRLELEAGGIKLYMCHGSPRKIDENIRQEVPLKELEEMVKGVNADIILCGHTHVPFGVQLKDGRTIMNVGSVGRPMTIEKAATYAILDTRENGEFLIEHQAVEYDNKLVAEKIKARGFKECEDLARLFVEEK